MSTSSLSSPPPGPLPPSSPPEIHTAIQEEAEVSRSRVKRTHDEMDSNHGRPNSSGSQKDEDSQTPRAGSPTQTLTPCKPIDTQRKVTQVEEGAIRNGHGGPDGAEDGDQSDPAEPIEYFDWRKLEDRYHDAIGERNQIEQDLFEEFNSLINFFNIWANTTQTHEVDRSFSRLRTRMAHVQNSETTLEQKRLHYIQVVQAFESALQLLNQR